jgi:hypothetical protein
MSTLATTSTKSNNEKVSEVEANSAAAQLIISQVSLGESTTITISPLNPKTEPSIAQ